MNEYTLSEIRPGDKKEREELLRLLTEENIRLDANLDYTVGLYDADSKLIATGSCFANTLRCLAVDGAHQGERLLNSVVTHLVEYQAQRGNSHLFLYTKTDKTPFFADLGFYEIARAQNKVAFMENRRDGFSSFLNRLAVDKRDDDSAGLVMNCNPFTLGHRRLAEEAAAKNATAHLFVVTEDASLFSFADRYAMVAAGCADLDNIVLHETGSYMISCAVFPSYFLEDEASVIEVQARLDIALFAKVASVLGIRRRYVGEEPFSRVTGLYNDIMAKELPVHDIECVVVPRRTLNGQAISASRVRQLIHDGQMEAVRSMVPSTTFDYFSTDAGRQAVRRIQASPMVIHY